MQARLHSYHVAISRLFDGDGLGDHGLGLMHPQAVERHIIATTPYVG